VRLLADTLLVVVVSVAALSASVDAGAVPTTQRGVAAGSRIEVYRPVSGLAYTPGSSTPVVVLRSFTLNGQPRWLTVDPDTMRTAAVAPAGWRFEARPWPDVRRMIGRTPYGRALEQAQTNEDPTTDAGVTHLRPDQPGIDLTVDLCPSHRPLDRRLLLTLVAELGQVERPVPIAVAVTGVWMREHPDDLQWLISLVQAKQLAITWVNHSFNHRFQRAGPLTSNFLLEPGTNLDEEVLGTERALLERGVLPSVFFRFPGLVSSHTLIERVLAFGLVPVGSDAWLAKNEWPKPGSIVLVHANGNEPLGVSRFIDLLHRERALVRARQWLLLDLRESVVETERGRGR
jgi:hypothetical protein